MNQINKKIVILGCGWLGKLTGEALIKDGFQVFGSYRSENSKRDIEKLKIEPIHLDLQDISQYSMKFIGDVDYALIMFPPKSSPRYSENLVQLASYFSAKTKFVFTSSIGVYPKLSGTFNEDSEVLSEKLSPLVSAENKLRKYLKNRITILRLGGLFGPNRHPIKYIQGKEFEDDGTTPINLIHSSDVTKAIRKIIESDSFGRIYNLVFPDHSQKKEYYSQAAEKLKLSPPKFGSTPSIDRKINGNRIEAETSFRYTFPVSYFTDFE